MKKCQGYPGAILPTEALRLPSGLTLAPLVRRDVTSRLNSAGRTILPSWLKKRFKEVCWWVAARRLVHLNPQNPPLQPHGSHLTANKAPTSEERERTTGSTKGSGTEDASSAASYCVTRDMQAVRTILYSPLVEGPVMLIGTKHIVMSSKLNRIAAKACGRNRSQILDFCPTRNLPNTALSVR